MYNFVQTFFCSSPTSSSLSVASSSSSSVVSSSPLSLASLSSSSSFSSPVNSYAFLFRTSNKDCCPGSLSNRFFLFLGQIFSLDFLVWRIDMML